VSFHQVGHFMLVPSVIQLSQSESSPVSPYFFGQ